MSRRPELVKPEGITIQEWIGRLESEKRDLVSQMRREIHTRGNTVQGYCDRVDRALVRARASALTSQLSRTGEI